LYQPKKDEDLEKIERLQLLLQQSEQVRQHYQSPAVGVVIPGLQAAISGLFAAGVVSVVWWRTGWHYPLEVVFGTFFAVALLVWILRVKDWSRLIWSIESSLQVDLNGDQTVGAPPKRVKVDTSDGRGHQKFIDLWGDDRSLAQFLTALLNGQPTGEKEWTGRNKPFSEKEHGHNMAELLRFEIVQPKNPAYPKLGVEPTPDGERWIERTLEELLPYPTAGD
jgi:hypothetical protein